MTMSALTLKSLLKKVHDFLTLTQKIAIALPWLKFLSQATPNNNSAISMMRVVRTWQLKLPTMWKEHDANSHFSAKYNRRVRTSWDPDVGGDRSRCAAVESGVRRRRPGAFRIGNDPLPQT